MTISLDAEKSFDLICHLFMLKTLRKLEMSVTFLYIIKEINETIIDQSKLSVCIIST